MSRETPGRKSVSSGRRESGRPSASHSASRARRLSGSVSGVVRTARWGPAPPCLQRPQDRRQLGGGPENADAVNALFRLAGVVVHDADDAVARRRAPHGRADEELGIVAGAQQQHRDAPPRFAAPPQHAAEAAVQHRPVDDTRAHQQREQDEPVDEKGRAGIGLEPRQREEDGHEHQHREARRLDDQNHVAERGVAPDPAIDARAPEDERRDRGEEQHPLDEEAARHLPERAEAMAQQQGERKRHARHGHVVSRYRVRAVDD